MFTAIKKLIRRLFGKEPEPQARSAQRKGGKHLSHEDRRQIEAAIAKAKGKDKTELSAQDSIPETVLTLEMKRAPPFFAHGRGKEICSESCPHPVWRVLDCAGH